MIEKKSAQIYPYHFPAFDKGGKKAVFYLLPEHNCSEMGGITLIDNLPNDHFDCKIINNKGSISVDFTKVKNCKK